MIKEYRIETDEIAEPEEQMKILLCEDVIFFNNGHWNKDWPKDRITVHVNCNDIFVWGCADAEDVLYSELESLFAMYMKDPMWGAAAWCIKKRKQMPQPPVASRMIKAGYNLEELIA